MEHNDRQVDQHRGLPGEQHLKLQRGKCSQDRHYRPGPKCRREGCGQCAENTLDHKDFNGFAGGNTEQAVH